jgi:hypothetical protein
MFPMPRNGPGFSGQFVQQQAPARAAMPQIPAWNVAPAPQRQGPPQPVIRGQAEEEQTPRAVATAPRTVSLSMPSPEELGVTLAPPGETTNVDWTSIHGRLDQLGATCFHLERFGQGGCRITCLLPINQQGKNHRIEAQADNEAEAVRLTLAKAEEWTAGR